ncbi:hypothetical protein SAMN05421553_4024 [Pseudomonas anguilliseptica]|uniref:Uncharacterized protein n=1 Tax=Pseudomonas anguilliseptica TaxID=53406 RepID=A0A1H5G0V9_PSEAG|nr:hypothetical protein SAMN05421553_4017 [Pseudomonas anguilliseptica]SEE09682.1 hypothetical protein SAMN05421553_4024 [Pseudomonas anguilliseptica]
MESKDMTDQLRLTKDEQELLRKKSIEINNILIKHGHRPLDDPKLLHKILEISLPYVRAKPDGELWIEV